MDIKRKARLSALDDLIGQMEEDLATSHLPEEVEAAPETPEAEPDAAISDEDAAGLASNMEQLFS